MGKLEGMANASKYVAPSLVGENLDKQMYKALDRSEIKDAMKLYSGSDADFKKSLKLYISEENRKNERLNKVAGVLDAANKALVPVDATLDAIGWLGGIGFGAKALIDVFAKLPSYAAYNAYYMGKTHDTYGLMKNAGYEVASWFSPGSIPHLFEHYAPQAEEYSVKKGSEMFLKGLEKRSNVIRGDFGKKGDLEDLALAA